MKLKEQIFISLIILMICLSCNRIKDELPKRQLFSNELIFPDTTYNLELTYIGMGCPCPQWATIENIKLYELNSDKIPMDSLFLTISEEKGYQQNPFDLDTWKKNEDSSNTFIFKGRHSTNKFKWQSEDGKIWNNKVFQYSNCKLVEKNKNDH